MPGIESCLRAWTRQRDGLKRPSPIAAPGMLTIESFKNQRIRGPAPKAQREGVAVMGYWLSAISFRLSAHARPSRLFPTHDLRLLALMPPIPHPAAPRGLGHSTSARHRRDVAEREAERRAPRVQPDGGSPPDRSGVILAPSDRGAPRPAAPARQRSRAAPARSPGPNAARRARSPWQTAGDLLFHRGQWPDPGS